MSRQQDPGSEGGAGYRHLSLGFTFAGGILLFLAAGYGLDRWLGTLPFGTVIGTLVGAVVSFKSVYRRIVGLGSGAGDQGSGGAKRGGEGGGRA